MADLLIDKLSHFFKEQPGVASVYLFGSRVQPREGIRNDSDVDVAVLFEPEHIPSNLQRFQLQAELAVELQCDVDLVSLNKASPILRHQVLAHGRAFMIRRPDLDAALFVKTVMEYADLKRMRAPIEQAIAARGNHG